jgi:hypothetical protein
MQTLHHFSSLADCLFAVLALVALVFILDQLGLRVWIAWLIRHDGKPKNTASKEYWNLHE